MRVMVPPEGIGVVGVKVRVTATDDLSAILSEDAISRLTDVTAVWLTTTAGRNAKNKIDKKRKGIDVRSSTR